MQIRNNVQAELSGDIHVGLIVLHAIRSMFSPISQMQVRLNSTRTYATMVQDTVNITCIVVASSTYGFLRYCQQPRLPYYHDNQNLPKI